MLKSSRKGFTLIEIIVVIVIIAVLMAIAVPSVMSYMKEGSEAKYLAVSRAAYQNMTVEISKLEGGSSDYKTIGMACKAAIEKANTSTDDNLNISRFQINYDDSSANISMRLPKIGNGYSQFKATQSVSHIISVTFYFGPDTKWSAYTTVYPNKKVVYSPCP